MQTVEFAIISLPRSTDRREMVAERMSKLRWKWRFFDASSAIADGLSHDPERVLIRRGYKLSEAEIGCFSSHISCLKEYSASASSASDYLIVIEDDVFLDMSFDFDALPGLMDQLGIHYMRLYSRFVTRAEYIGRIGLKGLYRFVVPPYGTQAYIVSKAGAKQLVQSITRIDRPIDDEMDRYWVNGLPTYALFPYPAIELNLQSTIVKGFAKKDSRSRSQKLKFAMYTWLDKIPRELASLKLKERDRAMSELVQKLATRVSIESESEE
jgi:glycosyl transferase family 25